MKRFKLFLIIALPVLVFGAIVLRWVGVWNMYTFTSPSMSPAIEMDELMFTSNLPDMERDDIIAFDYIDTVFGPNIYAYRVKAFTGETVELRNGLCYINGELNDELPLRHAYMIEPFTPEMEVNPHCMLVYTTHCICQFDSIELAKANLIEPALSISRMASEPYPPYLLHDIWSAQGYLLNNYSPSNFGPVTVPPEHVFVLGDNRDNARDSRYIGFVPIEDIVGVVLNH